MASGRSSNPRLWLLEIDLGHVYRFSTEAVDVVTDAGVTLRYAGGLAEPTLTLGADTSTEDASTPIAVASDVDWALLLARGVPLEGRSATLRRWEKGTTFERARVALRGKLSEVKFGTPEDGLGFVLLRSALTRADTMPEPQAVIDSTTWPVTASHHIPDRSVGLPYPIPIGCPGRDDGNATAQASMPVAYAQAGDFTTSSPTTSYIVIADGPIGASTVLLYDLHATIPTAVSVSVSTVTDLLGRTVSVVAGPYIDEEAQWYVGFPSGKGITHDGAAIRTASEVIEWALIDHTDLPVDFGRLAANSVRLDAYQIDGWIAGQVVNVMDWLTSEVLPLLPVELRESDLGIYPVFWRWTATARDAVAVLDATQGSGNVQREGVVSIDADIANEITILYRPAADGSTRWRGRRIATRTGKTVAADTIAIDDSRVIPFRALGDSQDQFGLRPLTIEAASVCDDTTAELILRDQVHMRGWPRRRANYSGAPWLETLRIGDVVLITDPEVHFASEVALVWDLTPGESPVVALVLLDHPSQLRRSL